MFEHHEALKLPKSADILDGKIKKMPDGISFSGQYAMIGALEYELKDRYNDYATYLDFIHNNFPKELCAFSIRNVIEEFTKNMKKELDKPL